MRRMKGGKEKGLVEGEKERDRESESSSKSSGLELLSYPFDRPFWNLPVAV